MTTDEKLDKILDEIFDIKALLRLHTKKLNAIEEAIHIQTEHSTLTSDRVRELERRLIEV